jgi:hypothetical protein
VIATGASVLSFDYNIPLLKRLGHIFFIDRDSEILLADPGDWEIKHNNDAPVSLNTMLVKSHLDLDYAGIADSRVENNGGEDEGFANLVAAIREQEEQVAEGGEGLAKLLPLGLYISTVAIEGYRMGVGAPFCIDRDTGAHCGRHSKRGS